MTDALTTPDIEALHARLDECFWDYTLKAVLADALDEIGSPLGPGYRALAVNCKDPGDNVGPEVRCKSPDGTWKWFSYGHENFDFSGGGDSHFDLPKDWFDFLEGGDNESHRDIWRDYSTRRGADDIAALAFTKLPPERQQEILGGCLL